MRRFEVGLLAAAGAVLIGGCGVDPVGESPPADAFYYPVGVAAHPEGRYLYVTNGGFDRRYNAGTISVFDTQTRRILGDATVRIGLFAGEIVLGRPRADAALRAYTVTRDDNRLLELQVTEDGRLDCGQTSSNRRCADAFVRSAFDGVGTFADDPYGLALDEGALFVAHIRRGVISRWATDATACADDTAGDCEGLAFGCRLNLAGGASSVAVHPILGWGYVTDRFGQTIQVLEPTSVDRAPTGTLESACELVAQGAIAVDPGGDRGQTRGLAFSADGTLLYVASSIDPALKIYDTSIGPDGRPRNQSIATIVLGSGPDVVRVAGLRPGETRSGGSTAAPGLAELIVEHKGEGLVYATAFNEDRVVVMDPATFSVLARIPVGDGPHDIAFQPDVDGRLRGYVTNFNDHTLSVLDLEPGSPHRFTEIARIR